MVAGGGDSMGLSMLSLKMPTRFECDFELPGTNSCALCRLEMFAPGVTFPSGDLLLKEVSLNLQIVKNDSLNERCFKIKYLVLRFPKLKLFIAGWRT